MPLGTAIGLHFNHIDHTLKIFLGADGKLYRETPPPEVRLKLLHHLKEVRILAIDLVDEDEAGKFVLLGIAPHQLSAHLHARSSTDNDNSPIGDAHRRFDLGDKVSIARGVNDVQFEPLPLTGK
ncbi:hypothetical protein ES703_00506 [subsurface metagenome]